MIIFTLILEYFREYKIKNGIKNAQNKRSYLDKIKIKSDFITTLASTGIFKRFARGFNGNLIWFKWKLQSIIRASKIARTSEKHKNSTQSVWWIVAWFL